MPKPKPRSPKLPPLPARPADSHKGDYGRVLVVAGSRGMLGAACLTSMGALRGGAGLVTLALPGNLLLPASIKLTEVILKELPEASDWSAPGDGAAERVLELCAAQDLVVLGPGLGMHPETAAAVKRLYADVRLPMVVDADGLNILASNPRSLAGHAGPRILTPHPGEMGRLLGVPNAKVQERRAESARDFARALSAIVVLKGHRTVVSDGTREFVNATGNPGMATAGSGDVLAGLIGALWAQKLSAFDAARLGVHLHGAAGDLAARRKGMHSLIAGDLLEALPEAFLKYPG